MERCEVLYEIIKKYDAKGDYLWPSKLATLPEVSEKMRYAGVYKHLAILVDRGLVSTAKVKVGREKPIMTGRRDATTYEYAHIGSTKVKTWDPNKKLIYIEELATMSDDEKERLFNLLDGIDKKLSIIAGIVTEPPTEWEKIANREVK